MFDGTTKVCEQSNNPVFTESTVPGSPWNWLVSNIRGFGGGADFSFGTLNGDGTQAELQWTAIEDTDWQKDGGCEGLFDLTLTNGVDMDITYPDFQVSLRYLGASGYTVFQGQTSGSRGIPESDTGTYTFSAPLFSAELPGDLDLTMNNVGAVTAVDSSSADWTEDGTFMLRIQDGSRPYSELTGIPLSLRRLEASGYTVFQGQTSGGRGIPESDTHTYTFSAPLFSTELPGDLTLTMNNLGAVTAVDSLSADWTEDGTFTVRIQDGSRPYSELPGIPLSLRRLVGDGLTIIDGQSYQPTVAETEGVNAAGVNGFSFTADDISLAGVAGASLTFDAMCRVTTYGFPGSSWNQDGDFTLYAKDGTRPTSVVTARPLTLRKLIGDGLTIIDGQSYQPTVAETEGVNAAGVNGFSFTADDISLAGVAGASLTFDAMCRVTTYGFPGSSWNQDGDFTLYAKDGTRPTSVVTARPLTLRKLIGDGLTIIDGQSYQPTVAETEGVNAAGVNGFSFTAPAGDISLAGVAGASLTFDAMCRVTTYGFPGSSWNQDGDFTLCAKDGARPTSVIPDRTLSLRQLVGDGMTIIDGQSHQPTVAGTEGVNAAGVHGFSFTADDISIPGASASSITFDAMCRVTTYGFTDVDWDETGDFTLCAKDGARPSSVIPGRTLSLRRIIPAPLTIPDNGSAGSINLQVGGDAGPWDWFDYEDGLAISELTAPDTSDSSSLTISWEAGALEPDETGTGEVTVQRSDGSAPASTVALDTVVTPAPPVPVAFWPILVAMLAVAAVVLMTSQKYRTLS
ncbi:MAG TPA: hypothetical protein VMZ06_13545 [Candidatus Bathyarchaeia archaeon]|nr:hypothetical protein [Candidatus Bathyarchaeia archaeon]